MKPVSCILLVVLLLTALSPLSALTFPVKGSEEPVLGTLDVCRSAAPALSSNGSMPCMSESPATHAPVQLVAIAQCCIPILSQILLPSQNDRPPQA